MKTPEEMKEAWAEISNLTMDCLIHRHGPAHNIDFRSGFHTGRPVVILMHPPDGREEEFAFLDYFEQFHHEIEENENRFAVIQVNED
jgi:hypothetical protein